MKIVLLVLMAMEFACVMYYKKRAKVLEKGFSTLAKMAYNLKTPAQCEELARKLCEAQANEGSKR